MAEPFNPDKAVEIERKFLIKSLPDRSQYTPQRITQGYIAIASYNEVRLRRVNDQEFYITVKGPGTLERPEREVPLTQEQFDELWPTVGTRVVEKLRFNIPWSGTKKGFLELDEYKGALDGLYTVEAEFSSRTQSEGFSRPYWLGQEVTLDDRYKNRNLALEGLPDND